VFADDIAPYESEIEAENPYDAVATAQFLVGDHHQLRNISVELIIKES
jgi:hypothetical protein